MGPDLGPEGWNRLAALSGGQALAAAVLLVAVGLAAAAWAFLGDRLPPPGTAAGRLAEWSVTALAFAAVLCGCCWAMAVVFLWGNGR